MFNPNFNFPRLSPEELPDDPNNGFLFNEDTFSENFGISLPINSLPPLPTLEEYGVGYSNTPMDTSSASSNNSHQGINGLGQQNNINNNENNEEEGDTNFDEEGELNEEANEEPNEEPMSDDDVDDGDNNNAANNNGREGEFGYNLMESKLSNDNNNDNEPVPMDSQRSDEGVNIEVSQNEITNHGIREDDQDYPNEPYFKANVAKKILEQIKKGKYDNDYLIFTALLKKTEEKEAAELAKEVGKNHKIKKLVFRSGTDRASRAPKITSPIIHETVFKELEKSPLLKTLQSLVCHSSVEYQAACLIPLLDILLKSQTMTELRIKLDHRCMEKLTEALPTSSLRQLELHIEAIPEIRESRFTRAAKKQVKAPIREVSKLMEAIASHHSLQELVFSNCSFEPSEMECVASMLGKNRVLRKLKFYNNEFDSFELETLFKGMAANGANTNSGVQLLEIADDKKGTRYRIKPRTTNRRRMPANPINVEALNAMSYMLTVNKSLLALRLLNMNLEEDVDPRWMFEGLRYNKTLTTLDIKFHDSNRHAFNRLKFNDAAMPIIIGQNNQPLPFKHSLKCLHINEEPRISSVNSMQRWLLGNQTLQVVDLMSCHLSAAALVILSKTLKDPNCKIACLKLHDNHTSYRKETIDESILVFKTLFEALPHNRSIRMLDLSMESEIAAIFDMAKTYFEQNKKHHLRSLSLKISKRFFMDAEDIVAMMDGQKALLRSLQQDNRIEAISLSCASERPAQKKTLAEHYEQLEAAYLALLKKNKTIAKINNLAELHFSKEGKKNIELALKDNAQNPKRLISFLAGFNEKLGKNSILRRSNLFSNDLKKMILKFAGLRLAPKVAFAPNPFDLSHLPEPDGMPKALQKAPPQAGSKQQAGSKLEFEQNSIAKGISAPVSASSPQRSSNKVAVIFSIPDRQELAGGGMGLSGRWGKSNSDSSSSSALSKEATPMKSSKKAAKPNKHSMDSHSDSDSAADSDSEKSTPLWQSSGGMSLSGISAPSNSRKRKALSKDDKAPSKDDNEKYDKDGVPKEKMRRI